MGYANVLRDRRFVYFLIAMLAVEMVFFQPLAAMPLFVVRDLHISEAAFGMLLAINTVDHLDRSTVKHRDVSLVSSPGDRR